MRLYDEFTKILKIQKFRRLMSYIGFYCFATLISYAYVSNTTRAGYSRADQFYASYSVGTELLTNSSKLYKSTLGNTLKLKSGVQLSSISWQNTLSVKGSRHMHIMLNTWRTSFLLDSLMEVVDGSG